MKRFITLLVVSCGLVMMAKGSGLYQPLSFGDDGLKGFQVNFNDGGFCYYGCSKNDDGDKYGKDKGDKGYKDDKGEKDGYGWGYTPPVVVDCDPPLNDPPPSSVPEPVTGGLLGLGLVGIGLVRRMKGYGKSNT